MSFKDQHEFGKRLAESTKIRTKYPDRVPVIVEIDNSNLFRAKDLPEIEKNKYLVPDINLSQFVFTIRKRMKLPEQVAIYVLVNKTVIPVGSDNMFTIYNNHKDIDGYLYLTIIGESFFG